MTTRPIVTLWQEELERDLTTADVPVVEAELGLRMMGWYRDLPTLAVKTLARAGDDSALLRIRTLTPGQTLFEATSTLATPERFFAVRAQVLALVAMLAYGPDELRTPARLDPFDLVGPSSQQRDPIRLGRTVIAAFDSMARASFKARPHGRDRLWMATHDLISAVEHLQVLFEPLIDQNPTAAELRAAAERARRAYPAILPPRWWRAVAQVGPAQAGVPLALTPELHLFAVVEQAVAAHQASLMLPRHSKKRLRSQARAQLQATVLGYATLAGAAQRRDRNLLLAAHALLRIALEPAAQQPRGRESFGAIGRNSDQH